MNDELRGSTPVLSAKDVLLEVRTDVKKIGTNVDILVSQNLNNRVTAIETWKAGVIGKSAGIGAAVGAGVALAGMFFANGGKIG